MNIDKHQIKRRFAKAVSCYDKQAVIQMKVAENLLQLLNKAGCRQPEKVLEIGSCTGLLSKEIVTHFESIQQLFINDLVPEFQEHIEKKLNNWPKSFTFLPGDIETIDLPGSFDLLISSSTFHWLHDLKLFFAKLSHHLNQNGYLAFAMYGPQNLQEIRQLTGIGLDYHHLCELKEMVARHFKLIICEETTVQFTFSDPLEILNHLRKTGVNSLAKSQWTKKSLKNFSTQFKNNFSAENGVILTYHPIYCIATTADNKNT